MISLCLFCSAPAKRKKPICRFCFEKLQQMYLPPEKAATYEWGFPLITLFDWRDEKLALPRLVMALKSGSHAVLWDFFAEVFAEQFGFLNKPLFVPIPSRLGVKKDHAYLWAEALQRKFGGEIRAVLQRVDSTQQKQKNRGERAQIRFEFEGSLSNSFNTVFVIDDLIASGATMKAAIRALSPHSQQVWGMGLVRRSLL